MSALQLSTSSEEARRAYLDGEVRLLAAKPAPEKAFEKAIAADPDFALAHAGEARALFLVARYPQAKAAALMARELAKNLPQREKNNVEVVVLTIEGGAAKAYQLAREHLQQYPTDAMVLAPCTGVFGLIGFSGRRGREQELRDLLEELAPHWGEDPWFLVQLAFARCETGAIEPARKAIERAMALDPRSGHGAHVMAHVLYEAGEHERGLKFVQGWLPGYAREGLMHCHLSWHQALWQLELGDFEAAMRSYLEGVHPGGSWGPPINVLTDAAAFLWRAELAGRPRDAERWYEVKQYGDANFAAAGIAFADVHKALTYAATGDEVALEKLLGELRARQQAGKLLAGPIVPALAEAFDAFARKDDAKAIALIEPHMAEHERIGGSRAQRRLIEFTLAAARTRATRS
ncbi:MAG TPA: tetratricopeptide repeat protein [Burkholderiales bacterium]|nr:tetratricopeptide repeat protein [Burkholderiales bacterium]